MKRPKLTKSNSRLHQILEDVLQHYSATAIVLSDENFATIASLVCRKPFLMNDFSLEVLYLPDDVKAFDDGKCSEERTEPYSQHPRYPATSNYVRLKGVRDFIFWQTCFEPLATDTTASATAMLQENVFEL